MIWYIHNPFFIGGPNPTEDQLQQIKGKGVNLLISLLDEEYQKPHYSVDRIEKLGFIRYNIPIKDFNPPSISQIFEFLGLIKNLPIEARVYMHCWAGIGRTGTMAVAYWISRGLDPDSAVTLVRQAQPHAVESPEQMYRLKEFYQRFGKLLRPD